MNKWILIFVCLCFAVTTAHGQDVMHCLFVRNPAGEIQEIVSSAGEKSIPDPTLSFDGNQPVCFWLLPYAAEDSIIRASILNVEYLATGVCPDEEETPGMLVSDVFISKKKYLYVSINLSSVNSCGDTILPSSIDLSFQHYSFRGSVRGDQGVRSFAAHSVLATGNWYKVAAENSGIYRIGVNELQQLGISLPVTSADIRLFGTNGKILPENNSSQRIDDLRESAIYVSDGGDGLMDQQADFILFYAEGPVTWTFDNFSGWFKHLQHDYSDYTFYFLNTGSGIAGKRIWQYPEITISPDRILEEYDYREYYEKDSVNLLHSGRNWLGETFDEQLVSNFSFSIPNILSEKEMGVRFRLAARSMANSSFTIGMGNQVFDSYIASVSPNVNSEYAKAVLSTYNFFPVGDAINISLVYNKTEPAGSGWLDYIELKAKRKLVFHSGQMAFRNIAAASGGCSEYRIISPWILPCVWNVTNISDIAFIGLTQDADTLKFRTNADSLLEFVVFDTSSLLPPILIGHVDNQDLHSIQQADMLIITHPDFKNLANILADYHTLTDGFLCVVAEPQLIYNEFSGGKQDVSAIRDFVKMLYDRAESDTTHFPRYLLLFGDGSYDMKDRIGNNTNFIPTYQTLNSFTPTSSFVSDDYYGLLDDGEGPNVTGFIDIGIGRLPVKTITEAQAVIEKILRYDARYDLLPDTSSASFILPGPVSNFGAWRNTMTFIADDEDANLHFKQAEGLTKLIDSISHEYLIEKIYLDAYKQESTPTGKRYPEVNKAINDRMTKGCLLVNFTGHGGEGGWTYENILGLSDIAKWTNGNNLPAFITATCEFSRFDNPAKNSAGECIFLNADGGGIALFSTTRVAYAHSNEIINRNLIKQTFIKKDGNFQRMGDAIKGAKVACGIGVYMQNFTLLGDPAIRLAYPLYEVITDSINACVIDSIIDTLVSGTEITISGHIASNDGSIITDFSGLLYPTAYDQPTYCSTLANDEQSYIASFFVTDRVLAKGIATVKDGYFQWRFIVPKDVSYGEGKPRILYYAKSLDYDANGYFEQLKFSADNDGFGDNKGPDIDLFLDSEDFLPGDITGSGPMLMARLFDTSGINAWGTGIGHDITAILDDNNQAPFILNDFFKPDHDTYRSGTVSFPLIDLHEGKHVLSLKAWDMLNNSSEIATEFYVAGISDISVGNVYNFPNPFINYTDFHVEHNQTNHPLEISILIFRINGQLVKKLDSKIKSPEDQYVDIRWDGSDEGGQKLNQGIYIYRLSLIDEAGRRREKSGKLILLK